RSRKGNPSDVYGKWFNPYIRKKLKMPRNVTFHSLRHSFKDFCRDALIPRDLHQALTGHAKQTVGDNYGLGFSIAVKHQELSKIRIDISLPRPKPFRAGR
ncbi:MAG: site-specific integrase, partial [Gammaproteobacteria bacterium]